jgi:hypothetical protein
MLLIAIGKLSMMAGVDLLVEQLSADLKYFLNIKLKFIHPTVIKFIKA